MKLENSFENVYFRLRFTLIYYNLSSRVANKVIFYYLISDIDPQLLERWKSKREKLLNVLLQALIFSHDWLLRSWELVILF